MLFRHNKVSPNSDDANGGQEIVENQIVICNNYTCRICLQNDLKMVKPCVCTGSIGMVHEKCMISWIQSQLARDPDYKIRCEICLQKIYYLSYKQHIFKPENWMQNFLVFMVLSSVVFVILLIFILRGQYDAQSPLVKPLVITSLSVICLLFALNLVYMVFVTVTQRKLRIYRILDQAQIQKYNSSETQSGLNIFSSHSSINYRSESS